MFTKVGKCVVECMRKEEVNNCLVNCGEPFR